MTTAPAWQPPDLTQAEIDAICYPLVQGAAQVRFLRLILKLRVERRPNGKPLVNRQHYNAVRGTAFVPPIVNTSRREDGPPAPPTRTKRK